ncbi:hypothetical protein HanRHA438_Chr01g0038081 [Helianthus annuus]|nr:hypothetical protein HanRHA438_Chr01g0038081 [Helianthus annuus]
MLTTLISAYKIPLFCDSERHWKNIINSHNVNRVIYQTVHLFRENENKSQLKAMF